MKGIVLAGGLGSRLYPLTSNRCKQLLCVYDQPMIFYPLAILMLAEIKDILVISTPNDLPKFKEILGDGSQFGINLQYAEQPSPDGIAQALIIGEKFIGEENVALILGDNIFYGNGLSEILKAAKENSSNDIGTIFGYYVNDPQRFGIVEVDKDGEVISIEEKPLNPKSNYCVTGLYFYDNKAIDFAKKIKPSSRKELEITDLNKMYLKDGSLKIILLDEDYEWIDMGTAESLAKAEKLVEAIKVRDALNIYNLEEIAYNNKWIDK